MSDVARAFVPSIPDSWMVDASTSRQSSRNMAQALRLRGSLDLAALQQSVDFLVTRYQALWNISEKLMENSSDVLSVRDFSSLPIDTRESEARRHIHQQEDGLGNLKSELLLRVALARLSASENILVISIHRSLCGAGILTKAVMRELSTLYNAHLDNQSSMPPGAVIDPLPPVGQALGDQGRFDYWNRQMENAVGTLELPSDRPRVSNPQGLLSREAYVVPDVWMASVREFSRAQSVAPFTTLLAALAALLSRHSGQHQFFVGASPSNLEQPAEQVPSEFPSMLPVRMDLSGDPSFRELLQRVRRSSLEAVAYGHVPFFWLAEEARKRGGSLPELRLFRVALDWEQPAWEDVHFSGLTVSAYDLDAPSSDFELALHLEEQSSGLSLSGDYDATLFDPTTIQRFLGHYGTLLANAISTPQSSISRLGMLTEPERDQLLNVWNSVDIQEYSSDVPLQQIIEAQAEKTPDAVAVAFATTSVTYQRLTYAEFNARSNQLAAHLRSLGVTRNILVGVCLERSIDLLIALLAIIKAGGAYLPLDPDHPDDCIRPNVENARLGVLIGRSELAARLPGFNGKLVVLDWDVLEQYPKVNHPVAVSGDDLAYVIYTSGSSGQPKGVMIPRRALNNLLWSVRDWFQFGPRDVLLALTTIAFDIAGVDVWLPLLVGARVLMADRETTMVGKLLEEIVQREGITFLQCTPAIWKLLIDSGWQGNGGLQAVCTGEAMPKDLARKLFPRVACLWNMYGPTETTIWSTGYKFSGPNDPILIGRPIANTQLYILDQHLVPTPIGVPGELYIGGNGLADGYLHKPELTAERFLADPFSARSADRLYKTGDLARYRSDGNIECLGRSDDQIKLRGFRIEPEEIRAAIMRHPSIRDGIATLHTGATGDSRIVAYLISQTRDPPDATALRNFLRQRLPDYMIPASFVFLDSLPLNANGKIDRRALVQLKMATAETAGAKTPVDSIEEQLREIWRSVLSSSEIGVNDDFFDLGGYSLNAAQLFREINICFNLDLPLATLFHAPTVRTMAAVIRNSGGEQMNAPIVRIQPNGSRSPLYCIGAVDGEVIVFRRLALELGPNQPLYGLQPFRLQGPRRTVEQLAAAYLRELRRGGESRPFVLLGYSFGGLVAVEMARQLQRNGVNPPMVVLIDASYPFGCRQHEPWSQRIRRYEHLWDRVTNRGGLSHLLQRLKYGFKRVAHRASSSTVLVSRPEGASDVSAVQEMAAESYRIKSYNGRVHLFRAETQNEFLAGGAELGWSVVLSNLVVEEVPGDHGTINTGANLRILARKVRECLQDPVTNSHSPRA